jgi:hypothetical protein
VTQGKAPQKSFYNPLDLFLTDTHMQQHNNNSSSSGAGGGNNSSCPAADNRSSSNGGGNGGGAQVCSNSNESSSSSGSSQAAAAVGASSLQLLRQQAAVLALLECPSNNLKVRGLFSQMRTHSIPHVSIHVSKHTYIFINTDTCSLHVRRQRILSLQPTRLTYTLTRQP